MLGYLKSKAQALEKAESLLKEAVLASDPEGWEYFLARAKLEEIQKKKAASFSSDIRWRAYQQEIEAFQALIDQELEKRKADKEKLTALESVLEAGSADPDAIMESLEKLREITPENRKLLVALSYYSAIRGAWDQSLEYARSFLSKESRESAGRLGLGMLEACLLGYLGRQEEAQAVLQRFHRRTRDPWYRTICETLQGKQTEEALKETAGESPEQLLTGHAVLGFWAEASGNKKNAIEHYKKALESFLDTWIEFDFSGERLKRLRKPTE